jgi:NADH:ubiquinone oxidoreductase subunit K
MSEASFMLLSAGLGILWVGLLGLLWRRSLIGMLVGLLFGWLSLVVTLAGFIASRESVEQATTGSALVLCVGLVCALQVALGLSLVLARVARRGSVDAQDAGLLEG